MYSLNQIQRIIKDGGLKATAQRVVLFKILANSSKHPGVDWIYETALIDHPSISLATVYKTMEAFVDAGIVRKVKSEDGKIRFDADTEKHNHIYCKQSGRIFDFRDEELDQLVSSYLKNKGLENFEMNDFQVVINGRVVDPDKPVQYTNSK